MMHERMFCQGGQGHADADASKPPGVASRGALGAFRSRDGGVAAAARIQGEYTGRGARTVPAVDDAGAAGVQLRGRADEFAPDREGDVRGRAVAVHLRGRRASRPRYDLHVLLAGTQNQPPLGT